MYELQVENMSCGGCARGVINSVQEVDQQAKVDVDLKSKRVRVETSAGYEAIVSAITNAGFPVKAGTSI